MKFELKSISVWSAIKVGFFLNLVLGFVMGLVLALFMAPIMAIMSSVAPTDVYGGTDFSGMSIGILLIILPISYALIGAVLGTIMFAIGAAVYNLIARIMGGFEMKLERAEWGEFASQGPQSQMGSGQQWGQPQEPGGFPAYTPTPGPHYPPHAVRPGPQAERAPSQPPPPNAGEAGPQRRTEELEKGAAGQPKLDQTSAPEDETAQKPPVRPSERPSEAEEAKPKSSEARVSEQSPPTPKASEQGPPEHLRERPDRPERPPQQPDDQSDETDKPI